MLYKIKIISVCATIIFFLLGLLSVLQYFRFQHLLFDVTRSRVEVPAEALKRDIERTLATGLPLQTNAQLQMMLNHVLETNPNLFSIQIVDSSAANGKALWSSARQPARSVNEPVFVQRWPIVDSIGSTVAHLTFVSDKTTALELLAHVRDEAFGLWARLCLVVLVILAPLLWWLLKTLDTIIVSARGVLLGESLETDTVQNSDVYQLAKDSQEAGLAAQTASTGARI